MLFIRYFFLIRAAVRGSGRVVVVPSDREPAAYRQLDAAAPHALDGDDVAALGEPPPQSAAPRRRGAASRASRLSLPAGRSIAGSRRSSLLENWVRPARRCSEA